MNTEKELYKYRTTFRLSTPIYDLGAANEWLEHQSKAIADAVKSNSNEYSEAFISILYKLIDEENGYIDIVFDCDIENELNVWNTEFESDEHLAELRKEFRLNEFAGFIDKLHLDKYIKDTRSFNFNKYNIAYIILNKVDFKLVS